jgi:cytoskeletal protein CcmA (bactofilin family)
MWKRDTSPKLVNPPAPEPARTPAETPAARVPSEPSPRPAEKVVLTVGKSLTIKGELSASEDLTLSGQMEGRVTLPDHTLTIGPGADIRAEITAGSVIIAGAVLGNVTARKRVEVRATGSVTGDIASPGLVIDDGGEVVGKIQMTGGKREARRTA